MTILSMIRRLFTKPRPEPILLLSNVPNFSYYDDEIMSIRAHYAPINLILTALLGSLIHQ